MVFGIKIGIDGKPVCPCCRGNLWHCEKCWNMYHDGVRSNDYIPPKWFGQRMLEVDDEMVSEIMEEYFLSDVKEDKNKPYCEGEYH